ncbi:MAG: hypothetical protein GY847_16940 [Proteobacteria bacterium]|nr:hypothetical protein [Pseudomonadota bacterium]
MSKTNICLTAIVLTFCWTLGCSKRQIMPGIVTGIGGATFLSGVVYRAALPDKDSEGLFGKQTRQKAAIATLMFTGMALVLVGVIWSATTPLCETDTDCWHGDVCDKATETCVPRPLATRETQTTLTAYLLNPLEYDHFELNLSVNFEPDVAR